MSKSRLHCALVLFWMLPLLGLGACSKSDSADEASSEQTEPLPKLSVFTVNYPLHYFAQRIGGNAVTVEFPAPANLDPAFWMPDAATITLYQGADLILLNGAHYAKWTSRVSLPESKLVDTSAGFSDRYIYVEDTVTHSHGPGGEHAHTGTAFTTWLDPNQAIAQAGAIRDALVRSRPESAEHFAANYVALEMDLLALDREFKDMTAGKGAQPLLASHPVYQYFVRAYELTLESMMWEPDELPQEVQWFEFFQHLKDYPAKWMIWEGEPLAASVERLAGHEVGSVVFKPCGNRPESGDYMSVMRANLDNLRTVF